MISIIKTSLIDGFLIQTCIIPFKICVLRILILLKDCLRLVTFGLIKTLKMYQEISYTKDVFIAYV